MSRQAGCNVWLKLENMQPTQSFKIRGIGNMCAKAVVEHNAKRFVTVGDTNAAFAVAYSGRQLSTPVSVFVPTNAQASTVRPKIELEGAEIVENGRTIKEAYDAACLFVQNNEGAVMVESADDISVISGHSTIVSEISIQLQRKEPAAIITTIGSGGLLAGIITGLHQCRWQSVPVIAVETHNTNTFQQSMLFATDQSDTRISNGGSGANINSSKRAGNDPDKKPIVGVETSKKLSLLPPLEGEPDVDSDTKDSTNGKPTTRTDMESTAQLYGRMRSGNESRQPEPTVATCLSSEHICSRALELSQAHPVVPISVSEAMAVEACRRLLDEHQLLVEAGSAAALSIIGKGLVHQIVPGLDHESHVVVIVTGGANINFDKLESYRQRFPYPAPIIAKSGHEIFMRMIDAAQPASNCTTSAATGSLSTSSVNASPAHVLGGGPLTKNKTDTAASLTPVPASK
ncbi:catabolic L-serine/threonine dehydratase [Coemansia spiralis]|uniref:L-serine ammonia-lyase n=2 Tax=Coemansia TaxID=4863 RepID=A0A9W8G834_9FUNG|nr:catabolic L-serine/threonine dehydratase [Coemansia umbellata]KAJ2625347.1 catabolic L-serine/threonine dehydratase [Coemansia sp. RSA 1358]KAJ2676183.1 catabolic L-serine/threonine dehydratase [Coemansia spiralis]